jgi:hypothetical protein
MTGLNQKGLSGLKARESFGRQMGEIAVNGLGQPATKTTYPMVKYFMVIVNPKPILERFER